MGVAKVSSFLFRFQGETAKEKTSKEKKLIFISSSPVRILLKQNSSTAAGCTASTRWEQASAPNSAARRDPRWGALRSDGERKAAFGDWASRRKRREREALGAARDAEVEAAAEALGARWRAQQRERREKRKKKKEEAEEATAPSPASPPRLLLPHPNRATVASVSASFKAARSGGGAAAAAAWNSLSDEEARQLAVERWKAGAAEEASKEAAKTRAETKEKLLQLYRRESEKSRIEHGTKWEEARAALEQRAKKAAAKRASAGEAMAAAEAEEDETELLVFFASAPPLVALEAFEEHLRDLRRLWKEQGQEQRDARLREERRNRDAFRDLLSRCFAPTTATAPSTSTAAPPLAPRCRWREARRVLASEPAFAAVRANLEGSTPRELFEVALAASESGFEGARAALLASAAAKGLSAASGEEGRSLFDVAADEAGGAAAAAPPAVRALVWSELVAGGRDAFWAAQGRQQKERGSSKKGNNERSEQGQHRQGAGKKTKEKKRGRHGGGEDDDCDDEGDGGNDDDDAKKHRRTRRRSADEEEEEGQL